MGTIQKIIILAIVIIPFRAFTCEILKGKVVGIRDGDTIVVMKKKKEVPVRLAGVDAPEKNQAFGQRAKEFTADMVFGKTVKVLVSDEDRNGRKVGEVTVEDRSLNEEIVAAGLAWQDPRFSKTIGLAALQKEAQLKQRGLWIDHHPTPPWEFRDNGN